MSTTAALQTIRARIGVMCALALILALGLAAQARADSVTNLGALIPMGLNNNDQVVGDVLDNDGNDHAALWSVGDLQMLSQLGSTDYSDAYAISQGGRIAGDDYPSSLSAGFHGVYWNGGGLPNQVGPFSGVTNADDDTVLNDVDTAGDLVGNTQLSDASPYQTGFFYRNGEEQLVGQEEADGNGPTSAGAITPDGSLVLGEVSLNGTNSYYIWSTADLAGTGTQLNIIPVKNNVIASDGALYSPLFQNALASDGTVLGYKGTQRTGTFYLQLLSGTDTTVSGLYTANAVNASHVVAGSISLGGGLLHAAIWQPSGTVTDLNTLLPPGSGWTLVNAFGINDNGDIVGIGDYNGVQSGFLLNTGASMLVSFGTIPQIQVGKVVDVPVTVTAGAVDLTNVSLGDGLSVSGNNAKVEQQAPDSSGFSLSAGESRTFTFTLKGLSEGDAGLSVNASASSARGNATDSAATSVTVWNPRLSVLRVKVPGGSGGTIDLDYRGLGWDPTGGPISLRFSGEDAGQQGQAAIFDGTLKISRWPKRTTDAHAIRDRGAGGYCSGELSASQGDLFASTKVEGKWAGWVLWSANPAIKAHEAWCEGEDYTFFAKSREPIVVFGQFGESKRFGLAVKVFGVDGPGTESPAKVLTNPGPVLSYYDRSRDVCVGVSLDHNGELITTATRGRCS
jgi:uncharacterized membrane protein